MKYILEIELADNKAAFVEEFFRSVTFIKKVKKISDEVGGDNLLMPEIFEDENFEWTWEE
jgi:hypothetical protein